MSTTPLSSVKPSSEDLPYLQTVATSLGVPLWRLMKEFTGPQTTGLPSLEHIYTEEQLELFHDAATFFNVEVWQFLQAVSIFPVTKAQSSTSASSSTITSGSSTVAKRLPPKAIQPSSHAENLQRLLKPLLQPETGLDLENEVTTRHTPPSNEEAPGKRGNLNGQCSDSGVVHGPSEGRQNPVDPLPFSEIFPPMDLNLDPVIAGDQSMLSVNDRVIEFSDTQLPSGISRNVADQNMTNEPQNDGLPDIDDLIDEFNNSHAAMTTFSNRFPQNFSDTPGLPLWSPLDSAVVNDASFLPLDSFMLDVFPEADQFSVDNTFQMPSTYDNGGVSSSTGNIYGPDMVLPSCVTEEFPSPAHRNRSPEAELIALAALNEYPAAPILDAVQSIFMEAARKTNSRQRKRKEPTAAVSGPKQIKKPRAPPKDAVHHLARQKRTKLSCLRCRYNKEKCVPNPRNSKGPCLSCENASFTLTRLPCLFNILTDCTLFRTLVKLETRFQKPLIFDLTDPMLEFLHPEQNWRVDRLKTIEISQGYGTSLQMQICRYEPLQPSSDAHALPHSYGIADIHEVEKAFSLFTTQAIGVYYEKKINQSDLISLYVFKLAYRMRGVSSLLRNVLDLWTCARYIEGGWHISGSELLGLEANADGKAPLSAAETIDRQVAAIIMQKLLLPLRKAVLSELQQKMLAGKPNSWLTIFLACYILLTSMELLVKQQRYILLLRKLKKTYLELKLVHDLFDASKVILSHFHYRKSVGEPFAQNWDTDGFGEKFRKHVELDEQQFLVVRFIATKVRERMDEIVELTSSNRYLDDGWFTGQLFLSDWQPPIITNRPPSP